MVVTDTIKMKIRKMTRIIMLAEKIANPGIKVCGTMNGPIVVVRVIGTVVLLMVVTVIVVVDKRLYRTEQEQIVLLT